MSIFSTKQTASINTTRIISGFLSQSVAAGANITFQTSIPNNRGLPVLVKVFFQIDSSYAIMYATPNLGYSSAVYSQVSLDFNMSGTALGFYATNADTVDHVFKIRYFLYADKGAL